MVKSENLFARIHEYLEDLSPQRPAVLREMEQYAEEEDFPIVGPLVGRFLYQMAVMTKARTVMELGSGFGYSAYWFSLAMGSRGKIVMTDSDRKNKKRAMDFFKHAGLDTTFDFRVGDALRVLRKQEGPFDIVLNDIDKKDYPGTIDLVAPKIRKGGLFITDNVIWKGKVVDKKADETTSAVMEFNRRLYRDPRFFTTILPIRDGIALALRV